jgi:hypothetical protein
MGWGSGNVWVEAECGRDGERVLSRRRHAKMTVFVDSEVSELEYCSGCLLMLAPAT